MLPLCSWKMLQMLQDILFSLTSAKRWIFTESFNIRILQLCDVVSVSEGVSVFSPTHSVKIEKKILFSNKKILPLTSNSLTTFPESVLGPGNYPWYLSSWVWIASAEQVQKILGYVVYSFRINIATKLWLRVWKLPFRLKIQPLSKVLNYAPLLRIGE